MSIKLKLTNISKFYTSSQVLHNINLVANSGEFIVLVGPSGSGKTTILRIIAGFEEASSGEVEINNKVVNKLPPKNRNIAMVFQNYALYPHMTVYDNLSFPLRMLKTKKDVIDRLVKETSDLLGIRSYLNKKPKELSGGEKQRVALGRAIVRKPELFLMDEPLSNLDAKLRVQMRSELLKLYKSLQATIIYVTHDQIEALTLGTRIVVLNEGKIQQIGSPSEVYKSPSNLFVAGFIGTPAMNFFEVKISETKSIILFGNKQDISLQGSLVTSLREKKLLDKEIILGIRPEHLQIISSACVESYGNKLIFDATVDLVEMLGNEHLIHGVTVNKGSVHFSLKTFTSDDYKRGDKIKVLIDLDKAYFFNKETGNRVSV